MKKLLLGIMIGLAAVPAAEAKPLRVVATLPVFADLAKSIGGEDITLKVIASPRFDPHFIEPKPSDVRNVRQADALVHAGLDLEAWRGPLLNAAGNTRVMAGQPGDIDLSQGISLLEVPTRTPSRSEGDIHLYGNPHYWMDPSNGTRMAQTVCDRLCGLDPAHCEAFRRNLAAFTQRLEAAIPGWRKRMAPYAGQELVAYHNSWPYLMEFLGLRTTLFLEPKPGIPPTPRHLNAVEEAIRTRGIRVIIQPSYAPPQAAAAVAKRTSAKVIALAQNVGEVPQAADYVSLIEYNVYALESALQ